MKVIGDASIGFIGDTQQRSLGQSHSISHITKPENTKIFMRIFRLQPLFYLEKTALSAVLSLPSLAGQANHARHQVATGFVVGNHASGDAKRHRGIRER